MKPCPPDKAPPHLRIHSELAIAREALREIADQSEALVTQLHRDREWHCGELSAGRLKGSEAADALRAENWPGQLSGIAGRARDALAQMEGARDKC